MSINGTAQTEYASLSGKIHTIVIDKTLSISGACADAKATGEAIEQAEAAVQESITPKLEGYIDNAVREEVDAYPRMTGDEVRAICV